MGRRERSGEEGEEGIPFHSNHLSIYLHTLNPLLLSSSPAHPSSPFILPPSHPHSPLQPSSSLPLSHLIRQVPGAAELERLREANDAIEGRPELVGHG